MEITMVMLWVVVTTIRKLVPVMMLVLAGIGR